MMLLRKKEEGLYAELEEKMVEPPFEVAVFEEAPKETLDQADLRSLEGIIFRQSHLKEKLLN